MFLRKKHGSTMDTPGSLSGSERAQLYVKLVMTAVFWGGTFVAGRIIAREVPPFSAAFLRFLVASFILAAFVVRTHRTIPLPKARQLLPLVVLGMTGVFAYNYCFFSGLRDIPANRASLVIATNPAFIAAASAAIYGERIRLVNGVGILASVCGAGLVVSRGDPALLLAGFGRGELFILGCVVSWATYSLVGKTVMGALSPLLAVTYACSLGTALLLLPALSEGMVTSIPSYSTAAWVSIVYLGLFGSAIGFIWYYEGVKAIGPSRAGVFINFVPLTSILLAYVLLNEPVDISLAVGACLVITGVALTNRS
ncbi:MAG: DMT family transporter [Syntrophobacteraceae bacterium]